MRRRRGTKHFLMWRIKWFLLQRGKEMEWNPIRLQKSSQDKTRRVGLGAKEEKKKSDFLLTLLEAENVCWFGLNNSIPLTRCYSFEYFCTTGEIKKRMELELMLMIIMMKMTVAAYQKLNARLSSFFFSFHFSILIPIQRRNEWRNGIQHKKNYLLTWLLRHTSQEPDSFIFAGCCVDLI